MRELTGLAGVDRRTVERWRKWWRERFAASPFRQIARLGGRPKMCSATRDLIRQMRRANPL
jgi:hypothetical protein